MTSKPVAPPKRPSVREIVIHERIGELRAALFDRDRIVELRLERWSTHESRARWGQIWAGRVTTIDPRISGAFVDLGMSLPAFVPFGKERQDAMREGALIQVRVVREAEGGKGPALAFEGLAPKSAKGPGLLEDAPPWAGWPGEPREATPDEIERIEATIEAALSPSVPVPGGGLLHIQATKALVAIDIDSAGRQAGGSDPANYARALNYAALPEIVRQIRLRGLGGLICVDFTGPRRRGDAEALTKALISAFDAEKNGGVLAPKTEVLPVSRFGIAEIARQKRRRSLEDICLDATGQLTGESLALDGIAMLAAVLRTAKGRQVTLLAPPGALDFLQADPIGWKEEIASEVGGLYHLEPAKPGTTLCEVRTQ
jgi:ribonuclease G